MNKALAILLLVICNMAAVFALSAAHFYVYLLFENIFVSVIIGLATVAALGFASSRLLPVFERKYSLRMRWFILASYVSPMIGMVIYWIVFLRLDAAHYFTGWFAGMGELLYGVSLALTADAYIKSGAVWSALAKHRLNTNKSPQ